MERCLLGTNACLNDNILQTLGEMLVTPYSHQGFGHHHHRENPAQSQSDVQRSKDEYAFRFVLNIPKYSCYNQYWKPTLAFGPCPRSGKETRLVRIAM